LHAGMPEAFPRRHWLHERASVPAMRTLSVLLNVKPVGVSGNHRH